jgi:hypothetical protein
MFVCISWEDREFETLVGQTCNVRVNDDSCSDCAYDADGVTVHEVVQISAKWNVRNHLFPALFVRRVARQPGHFCSDTFAVVMGERLCSSVQYLCLTLAVRETSEWRCPTASGSSQSLLWLPQQGQVRAR